MQSLHTKVIIDMDMILTRWLDMANMVYPPVVSVAHLTSHGCISICWPDSVIITREGRMRLNPIAIHTLNHPKKKVVLAREFEISPVNQPEGQEIAPWA